jgi:hypothetical protein
VEDLSEGACGDTSLVLGQFLHEAGFVGVEYICGDKYRADGKGYSHAWLRYEGLIVDITADQFPEVEEKVILTRSSEWHMGWEQIDRSLVRFNLMVLRTCCPCGNYSGC